jgi:hypothetical protein
MKKLKPLFAYLVYFEVKNYLSLLVSAFRSVALRKEWPVRLALSAFRFSLSAFFHRLAFPAV